LNFKVIKHNGPAVALVNGGEPTESRVQEYGEDQSFLRPNGSEPWHVFLPSWYNFNSVGRVSRYKLECKCHFNLSR